MNIVEYLKYSRIDQYHKNGITGKGLKIAVWEQTKVDMNFHLFKGKVFDPLGQSHQANAGSTHCHSVISVILKVAPDAEIYVYAPTKANARDMLLKDAYNRGCRLLNFSASSRDYDNPLFDRKEKELDGYEKGIFLIKSAGNTGELGYGEALERHWCAVGASEWNDGNPKRASYSSHGFESLDCMNLTNVEVKNYEGRTTYFAGTSAAAPYTTGMMALHYQRYFGDYNEYPSVGESFDFIHNNCDDVEDEGFDKKTGHGIFRLPRIVGDSLSVRMIKPDGKETNVNKYFIEEKIKKGYTVR
jgi:hypothetical protein